MLIRPGETARELWERALFPLGLALIAQVLDDIEAGVLMRVPQEQELAMWEPAIGRAPLFKPEPPLLGEIRDFEVQRSARFARGARFFEGASNPR